MKTAKNISALVLFLLMSFSGKTLAQQIIGTFETESVSKISSIEGASKYQESQPKVVDNPQKSGLNKSDKALYVKTKRGVLMDWWENAITLTLDEPVEITEENRYLHIMHYRTAPLDHWVIHTFTDKFINLGQGPCVSKRWVDLVVDLKSALDPEGESVNTLSNIRLELNGNWTPKLYAATEFYYDEILLDNSPEPRATEEVTTPLYVSGFEAGDYIPSYTMAGATDTQLSIVNNPQTTGANPSKKVLRISPGDEKNWWSRVRIPLKKPLEIVDANKYLHFFVLSHKDPCAFVGYFPGETWINTSVKRGEWTDVTIDLSAYMGKKIEYFDICMNSVARPNPICYIDSIQFDELPSRLPESFLDKINCILNIKDPDWTFTEGYPEFEISAQNTSNSTQTFTIECDIYTDAKVHCTKLQKQVTVLPGARKTETFLFENAVPNFYRLYVNVSEGKNIRNKMYKVFGYKPTEIVSPQDAQSDFDAFWANTIQKLKDVKPNYKVTPHSTSKTHTIYNVEMTSLDGYLLKGYYAVPRKEGKFPTIILSNGYNMTANVPNRSDDFIEFSYNIRGQGISNTKPFGSDWIIAGLPNKETYYYRGAYMDALRAVDFVCSRPEVDPNYIFAEGESQGGTLSFVIAALDERVKGVVSRVPFFSDFEDYYTIKENVSEISLWPMDVFDNYMYNHKVRHQDLFYMLTYFDIKNLTSRIKVPVLMASGLQDDICPPHINFAAFNQVRGEKEYYIGREWGHWVDQAFHNRKNAWYKELIEKITPIQTITQNDHSKIRIHTDGSGFMIEGETQDQVHISVHKVDGSLIYSTCTSLPVEKINCDQGMYLVRIASSQDCLTKKIVVKE